MPATDDYKQEVKEALVPNKVLADRLLALVSTNTNVMIELLESMKRLESAITGVPPMKGNGVFDRQPVLNLEEEEE